MENIILPPKKSLLYRLGKHPLLIPYKRLFILITLINTYILYKGIYSWNWFQLDNLAILEVSRVILFNFTLAILIRQQYVINFLFKVATSVPKNWPLFIRRICAKVYHFGGLHSSSASMGTIWYFIFVWMLYYTFYNTEGFINSAIIIITTIIVCLLSIIIIMALPKMRAKFHNHFEFTHRIGGWTVLALFWVQMFLFLNLQDPSIQVWENLDFWILIAITVSVILPWLRLKKVDIEIVSPSNHVALTTFDYGVTPFAGSSTALSRNPLLEWHSFANVPSPDKSGFRLTISRAGDWTGRFITDKPQKIWVKGIPTAGVGNVDKLFNKVIWVATGSGIGPCLPHLLLNETPSVLIWSTRSPEKTYGEDLVNEIKKVQPNAIIWNTDEKGKPDLVKLTYKVCKEFNAEAIICISNQSLTQKVVHNMEYLGIPAYGAIWDS
ncbi:hypothetical protein [Tenacibaculum sp. M341]|uniref:hypothetical protein n=1 Tax=Tenacibaculum sp. M341 TaxID=2530339 RepID=UPI001A9D8D65|nr:hypothetical protein [Tenacibaculum sp. M341]